MIIPDISLKNQLIPVQYLTICDYYFAFNQYAHYFIMFSTTVSR